MAFLLHFRGKHVEILITHTVTPKTSFTLSNWSFYEIMLKLFQLQYTLCIGQHRCTKAVLGTYQQHATLIDFFFRWQQTTFTSFQFPWTVREWSFYKSEWSKRNSPCEGNHHNFPCRASMSRFFLFQYRNWIKKRLFDITYNKLTADGQVIFRQKVIYPFFQLTRQHSCVSERIFNDFQYIREKLPFPQKIAINLKEKKDCVSGKLPVKPLVFLINLSFSLVAQKKKFFYLVNFFRTISLEKKNYTVIKSNVKSIIYFKFFQQ